MASALVFSALGRQGFFFHLEQQMQPVFQGIVVLHLPLRRHAAALGHPLGGQIAGFDDAVNSRRAQLGKGVVTAGSGGFRGVTLASEVPLK